MTLSPKARRFLLRLLEEEGARLESRVYGATSEDDAAEAGDDLMFLREVRREIEG